MCSIVLLGVWLFFRHKRKRQGSSGAGGGFKPEDTDSQSSGRRVSEAGREVWGALAWLLVTSCLWVGLPCMNTTMLLHQADKPVALGSFWLCTPAYCVPPHAGLTPFLLCALFVTTQHNLQRRRQGKRRYLLPDAPRPDSQPALPAGAGGSAGASSSGLNGAAAGAAGAAAGDMPAVGDDDTDLSPDQIRPQLRSLGDSVTSAVR